MKKFWSSRGECPRSGFIINLKASSEIRASLGFNREPSIESPPFEGRITLISLESHP